MLSLSLAVRCNRLSVGVSVRRQAATVSGLVMANNLHLQEERSVAQHRFDTLVEKLQESARDNEHLHR